MCTSSSQVLWLDLRAKGLSQVLIHFLLSLDIDIVGTDSTTFDVTRTSPDETYAGLGELLIEGGKLNYEAPAGSVTTFVGK